MQIAEIASINNRVFRTVGSPLVLPKHHVCHIHPVNHDTLQVTIDHVNVKHKNIESIQYRVANEKSALRDLDHFHSGKEYMIHLFRMRINHESITISSNFFNEFEDILI